MALSTKEQLLVDLQDDLNNIDSTLQNILNICSEKNIEIFIRDKNNENNFKNILKHIEYLNNFNIKNFVIDTIENKKNNLIYFDINFIYYFRNIIKRNSPAYWFFT